MRVFTHIESFCEFLERYSDFAGCVIQGLDLRDTGIHWGNANWEDAYFLGCLFGSEKTEIELRRRGATVFPRFTGLPYNPYRPTLYTREELMRGWNPDKDESIDRQIYNHFVSKGRHNTDVIEALAQRTHDHAIDDALKALLSGTDDGECKKVVGIMGGHGTQRTDPYFKEITRIARDLCRLGFFVATGGGPGIMEAGNLGAYLADVSEKEFDAALDTLGKAPKYTDPGYVEAAREVLDRHPSGRSSVAVPTWFYGHEPSNLFSPHIAKYFSNSIREDGLLAVATYGVIFAPGSAGTTQEIFMDAAQNHYATFDVVSPMIFLGTKRYVDETGLYPVLRRLAKGRDYEKSLYLCDTAEEAVAAVKGEAAAQDSGD